MTVICTDWLSSHACDEIGNGMLDASRKDGSMGAVWLTQGEWDRLNVVVRQHPDALAALCEAGIEIRELSFKAPEPEDD